MKLDSSTRFATYYSKSGIMHLYDPVFRANIYILIDSKYARYRERLQWCCGVPWNGEEESDSGGKYEQYRIGKQVYHCIWLNARRHCTLAHEADHAATRILLDRGIYTSSHEGDETHAYIVEFIVRNAFVK